MMGDVLVAALVSGRAQRALALVILAIMIAGLWWFGARPTRRPRAIGRLGADNELQRAAVVPGLRGPNGEDRGIGRFARPRHGRPPRL